MLENRIRKKWEAGGRVVNGWLSIPNALSAEVMSMQGFDSVCIDMQHGMIDFAAALSMLQALPPQRIATLVRVPSLEPGLLMKVLDAGAQGIIAPLIETRAQAEALAEATHYPPQGGRSYGPNRAIYTLGDDYGLEADAHIVVMAMIETRKGLDNLDAIASTPGIDALYVGPADLTLSLLGPSARIGFDREEPEMIDAIRAILSAAKRAGKRAGLQCGSPDYAARALEWGFDLVTLGSDLRFMAAAAASGTRHLREKWGAQGRVRQQAED